MKLRIEGIMKFITSLFLNTCIEKVNLGTLYVFLSCTLLILLLRQCGFVEFSGKIRQSNSCCKVHIGFILNQRKIFYFLGQNYRYIFSFEFLTWRGLCVLYDTMLRNFVCWRPARSHKAILFTIFSSSCAAFFSFSFSFLFFWSVHKSVKESSDGDWLFIRIDR